MRSFGFSMLVVALGIGTAACGTDDSCEGTSSCGSSGGGNGGSGGSGNTGATGGAGGSGADGGTCDVTKSPSEEACLVSDDYGVFVSPTGTDGGAGTKAEPLKSITEAASVASAAGKVVLVCAGTYDEHVMISGAAKVYGGFDCGTWAYDSANKPSVTPTTAGYALEVSSAGAEDVVVEDIAFLAKAGDATNPSSIAAFAHDSTKVTLRRVKLEAGAGTNGANGVLVEHTYPAQPTLDGNDATTTPTPAGGGLKTCNCPGGGQSIGGKGGDPTPPSGAAGTLGGPDLGAGQAGQPGSCGGTGTGKDGNPGTNTPVPALGAASLGVLSSTGFTPASGENGADGSPGQGGGGGASTATAGGGSGGCGGCGGAGGPGGKGGGASIALLAFNAPVVVVESELVASDAGDGATGAEGQDGQTDVGIHGNGSGLACDGGNGGAGGKGSAGGGGAGGVSAAIAYKGAKPSRSGGTLVFGEKGAPGLGGAAGTNDGADGAAGEEVILP